MYDIYIGNINDHVAKFFINTFPIILVFYHLPAGRPAAKYLDSFLQAYVSATPSYIKDMKDLICKLEAYYVGPDVTLIMMDVICAHSS